MQLKTGQLVKSIILPSLSAIMYMIMIPLLHYSVASMWVQVLKRTRGINHFQKYFSIISANISRRLESYAGLPSGSNVRDTVLIFNITNPNYAHPSHE